MTMTMTDYISIHALRVEGDCKTFDFHTVGCVISIHALRVEGDLNNFTFNIVTNISIHALRVEGDEPPYNYEGAALEFLSTPSGWRATARLYRGILISRFLSTPSGWRATL